MHSAVGFRIFCKEEEKLAWLDQAEVSSGYLFNRSWILSKSIRRLSKFRIFEAESVEIVAKHAMLLSSLECIEEAIVADQRVGGECGCTKYEGKAHQSAEPDRKPRHIGEMLPFERCLATSHNRF